MQRLKLWTALAYIICMPTQLTKHFWPDYTYIRGIRIDYLAPSIGLFEIVCIVLLLTHFDRLIYVVRKYSKIFFFIAVGLALHITFSIAPFVTLHYVAKMILFALAAITVVPTLLALQNARRVTLFLSGAALLQSTLVIWQFVTRSSIGGLWYWFGERAITLSLPGIATMVISGSEYLRPYGTFSHPNSLAGFFVVWYLLITFFVSRARPSSLTIWLTRISRVSIIVMLTLVASKAVLFVALMLHAVYFYRQNMHRAVSRMQWLALALGVFGVVFISTSWSGDPYSFSKRVALFYEAGVVFSQSPLTGSGLGTDIIAQTTVPTRNRFSGSMQPVHSIYALFLAESGIIGAIILATYIWIQRKTIKRIPLTIALALTAIALTGAVDHYWLTLTQNSALFWLVIAIAHAHMRSEKQLPLF